MIPLWAIAGAAAAVAGFGAAWQVQDWRADAAAHARAVNERATERLRRQNTETAATGFEQTRTIIQEKFIPIREEIERVVTKIEYRDRQCLDDDGVRAANRALRGLADDPGELGGAVPATPSAGGRPGGDGAPALR